ncbi:MAG: hypothetical protein LBV27_05870, partial [Oscillospiraceae bacterium]|nr:hypothetical protein [Oscillospiraceae bacterium]
VNKNIIEINETGSDCFERAILFVRPGSPVRDRDQLSHKARDYIAGLNIRRGYTGGKLSSGLLVLFSVIFGSAVTALVFLLI